MITADKVDVCNPGWAAPAGEARKKVALPALKTGQPLRIAFLNNLKPNTSELLAIVEKELMSRYPVEIKMFERGTSTTPPLPEVLEQIQKYADLVIAATGD